MNFISPTRMLSEHLLHRKPCTVSFPPYGTEEIRAVCNPIFPEGNQGAVRPRNLSTATVVQWWGWDSGPGLWVQGRPLSAKESPADPS